NSTMRVREELTNPENGRGSVKLQTQLDFENSNAGRAAWMPILRLGHGDQEIKVTVGLSRGVPFPSDAYIKFRRYPFWSGLFALLVLAVTVFIVLRGRRNSPLL